MAEFTAAVYQNEFLPDGGTDVNAIVTVTCSGAGDGGPDRRRRRRPRSSSSTPPGRWASTKHRRRAKQAALAALDRDPRRHLVRRDRRHDQAHLAYPAARGRHGADGRRAPAPRPSGAIGLLPADGGTAMGTWLNLAAALFASVPRRHPAARHPAHRRREPARDPPRRWPRRSAPRPGPFQCDCRGVGADWRSPSSGGSPRRCSAPSTSSRRRRDAGDFEAMMRLDGARRGRRASCGSGPRRAPRSSSSGRCRPRSRTSPPDVRGQPAHRRLPHRRLGRRVPRLPRRASGCRQGDRPGAARRAGAAGRRRPRSWRRAWSRRCGPTTTTLTTRINPAGRPLHRAGRARRRRSRRAWPPRPPATTRPRRPSSAGRCSSRPRPATTRPPPGSARSSTSTTPSTGTVRLAERRQARRDGPRHRVDEDHPGQEVRHLPEGHTSDGRPTTATSAGSRWIPTRRPCTPL